MASKLPWVAAIISAVALSCEVGRYMKGGGGKRIDGDPIEKQS
jgi:hypothetical protein